MPPKKSANNTNNSKQQKTQRRKRNRKRGQLMSTNIPASAMLSQASLKQISSAMQGNDSLAQRFAMCMALPGESAIRFPTSDMAETALLVSKDVFKFTTVPNLGPSPAYSNGDYVAAVFGQPGRTILHWFPRQAGAQLYTLQFLTDIGSVVAATNTWPIYKYAFDTANSTVFNNTAMAMLARVQPEALDDQVMWPCIGAYAPRGPHGQWLAAGLTPSREGYLLADAGDIFGVEVKMTLMMPNDPTTVPQFDVFFHFSTMEFDEPTMKSAPCTSNLSGAAPGTLRTGGQFAIMVRYNSFSPIGDMGTPGGTYKGATCVGNENITFQQPGYYALRLDGVKVNGTVPAGVDVVDVVASVTLSALGGTGNSRWCQMSAATLTNTVPVGGTVAGDPAIGYTDARVNGASVLWTNITPLTSRGGSIVAVRTGNLSVFAIGPNDLATREDVQTFDLSTGCYTFMEMTEARQAFKPLCIPGAMGPCFWFGETRGANMVTFSPGAAMQSFICRTELCLEFKTDLQRYNKRIPPGNTSQLINSRRLINKVPDWFFENPQHLRSIYQWIKSAGKKAVAYAPNALTMASSVMPSASPELRALATLMSMLNTRING